MEFYSGDTLANNLYRRDTPVFPENQIRFHVAEITCGILFLLKNFIIHGFLFKSFIKYIPKTKCYIDWYSVPGDRRSNLRRGDKFFPSLCFSRNLESQSRD